MGNELLAILFGYSDYANGYDGKKIFSPRGIVYTTYSEKYAKEKLNQYRKEAKNIPKDSRYTYKIAKADKYKKFLDDYNFIEWRSSIINDIDYHFRDLDKFYKEALKSGIRTINFSNYENDLQEIMCLSVKDIKYTIDAEESISARYRTSTWTFKVEGTLGKIPFSGRAYDVNGL